MLFIAEISDQAIKATIGEVTPKSVEVNDDIIAVNHTAKSTTYIKIAVHHFALAVNKIAQAVNVDFFEMVTTLKPAMLKKVD